MQPKSLTPFVRKWFSEWEPNPPRFGRATTILNEEISRDPDSAFKRILALVSAARDKASQELIGAGPLEDLLSIHGTLIVDRIEAEAARNPCFANCLACVWGSTRFDPEVFKRVQRITKSKVHSEP